jgi:hypothetical protein
MVAPAIYLAQKISSRVLPISAGQALASSMIWSILFICIGVQKFISATEEKVRLDRLKAADEGRKM